LAERAFLKFVYEIMCFRIFKLILAKTGNFDFMKNRNDTIGFVVPNIKYYKLV